MVSPALSWKLKERKIIWGKKKIRLFHPHTHTHAHTHTHIFHTYSFPYFLPENAGKFIARSGWAAHWKEAQPFLGVEADREQEPGTFSWSRHLAIHGLIQAMLVQMLAMPVELKKQSKEKWEKVHNEESPTPSFSVLVPVGVNFTAEFAAGLQ